MILTEGIGIGSAHAPSRVLFGPHETNLARDRDISDRHVAYYAARAAGGAGVLVTETASVHDSDRPYERAPLAADCGPGWAAVAEACRPHETVVLAGLGHSGSQGSSAFSQQALWAPSRVPDVASRELPMRMEPPEISALVTGFGEAADRAVRSGLHGVEVQAGQFSLLRQFLSGLTNQREDEHGTDRALLLREVLSAVREAVGTGVVGLRLSCDELAPWAGITPEAAPEIVESALERIDYLVVVRGSAMGTSATHPDLHTEPGFNAELCRDVRAAVAGRVPVVLQGSVVDPDRAQRALDEGVADLVEMTRAQIAEPDLVELLRHGDRDRIRPCVLGNQKCRVRDNRNPLISCTTNPTAGHETTEPGVNFARNWHLPGTGWNLPISREIDGLVSASAGGAVVLVVGGGPAGMEAARVLALAGRPVEVVERQDRLGGMVLLAAEVCGRAGLRELVDWQAAELRRLGVPVRLGVDVDEEVLIGREAVVATGSVPGPRGYRVLGGRVLEVTELLAGAEPAGPVVVFDPIGDAVGAGVAELLAGRDISTAIVTQDQVVGTQLAITGDLADANARLQRAGVALHKRSLLREVHDEHVVLEDVFTGARREVLAGTVVHCGHRLPDPNLPGPSRAGDNIAPRTIHEAVLEGRRVAQRISAPAGVS